MVDGRFTPDTTVYLGQERRRHLDERYAAQKRRRGKTGQIPHHAAAKGDNERTPVQPGLYQGVIHAVERNRVLELLAIGHLDHRDRITGRVQRTLYRITIQCINRRVGDNRRPAGQTTGDAPLAERRQ